MSSAESRVDIYGQVEKNPQYETDPSRIVAVTALALLGPLGPTEEHFRRRLNNESGIVSFNRRLMKDASGLRSMSYGADSVQAVAPVPFDKSVLEAFMGRKDIRRLSKFAAMNLAVAFEALSNAQLLSSDTGKIKGTDDPDVRDRIGIFIASGIGQTLELVSAHEAIRKGRGRHEFQPTYPLQIFPEQPNSQIARRFGINGDGGGDSRACASGIASINTAARAILHDELDIAIAGGTERILDNPRLSISIFHSMKTLSEGSPEVASSPMSSGRKGLVLGEGSAVVILERLDRALERGAPILATILGSGSGIDGGDDTKGDPQRAARLWRKSVYVDKNGALVKPDLYVGHFTATKVGDPIEMEALRLVFGDEAYEIPLTAPKSATGHGLGFSTSAAEAIYSARTGWALPTLNVGTPDPAFKNANIIREPTRIANLQVAGAAALGFGGHVSGVAFKRYGDVFQGS